MGDDQRRCAQMRTYTVTGLRTAPATTSECFARNAVGDRSIEQSTNAIPRTKPSAPAVRATRGNARVTLAWTPPTSSGGSAITRHVIQRSTSPTTGWVNLSTKIPATARSFTATGLRNSTRYYFRVAAVNAAGMGSSSAVVSAVPVAPSDRRRLRHQLSIRRIQAFGFLRHRQISIAETSPSAISEFYRPIRTDSTATTTASAARPDQAVVLRMIIRPPTPRRRVPPTFPEAGTRSDRPRGTWPRLRPTRPARRHRPTSRSGRR